MIMFNGKYIYKVVTFDCTFMSKDKFQKKLEENLNTYSADGWELHSFETTGQGTLCTIIFQKNSNEAILEKY